MAPPRREVVTAMTGAAATVDVAARSVAEDVNARSGQRIFGFVRRLGLSDEEAADVLQEALLRLLRALGSGSSIADPVAWTYRVAYRLAMDRHRLRRRLEAITQRLARGDEGAASRVDDLLAVWSEVDRLPSGQRAVVYLRYRSDLSFDAIGMVLGIDASSARSQASRAIAHLRARLGEER